MADPSTFWFYDGDDWPPFLHSAAPLHPLRLVAAALQPRDAAPPSPAPEPVALRRVTDDARGLAALTPEQRRMALMLRLPDKR